eukprot:RCo039434
MMGTSIGQPPRHMPETPPRRFPSTTTHRRLPMTSPEEVDWSGGGDWRARRRLMACRPVGEHSVCGPNVLEQALLLLQLVEVVLNGLGGVQFGGGGAQDLRQHGLHVAGHVLGIPADVQLALPAQHVPHQALLLLQQVLHVHLVRLLPGERHKQRGQHPLIRAPLEEVLVEVVLVAVAAPKEEVAVPGLRSGTGGLQRQPAPQEPHEGGHPSAGAHQHHRQGGVAGEVEGGLADVHRHGVPDLEVLEVVRADPALHHGDADGDLLGGLLGVRGDAVKPGLQPRHDLQEEVCGYLRAGELPEEAKGRANLLHQLLVFCLGVRVALQQRGEFLALGEVGGESRKGLQDLLLRRPSQIQVPLQGLLQDALRGQLVHSPTLQLNHGEGPCEGRGLCAGRCTRGGAATQRGEVVLHHGGGVPGQHPQVVTRLVGEVGAFNAQLNVTGAPCGVIQELRVGGNGSVERALGASWTERGPGKGLEQRHGGERGVRVPHEHQLRSTLDGQRGVGLVGVVLQPKLVRHVGPHVALPGLEVLVHGAVRVALAALEDLLRAELPHELLSILPALVEVLVLGVPQPENCKPHPRQVALFGLLLLQP